MKKASIIITMLTLALTCALGQASNDSITIKKVFGGYQFYQGANRLNMSQLVKSMETNELAYEQIKAAQSTNTLTSILGFAGGFMVGWPIGAAIGNGDPNWAMAGIGAGLIVVSIPLSQKFNKQVRQAVDTFNADRSAGSFWDNKELNLSMTDNGIGLTLHF
ncbi:hypothetical protein [Carboxylicivirga sp. M1479]|uniref:hypothetical protein n=1 Tax=Carboxylicivirga sp. M1479 TaxID=2594476 RepID=UPI0011787A20|nr:hypothetical protein [Carboxylicivirga sp. M1479]TRX65905.1 hypothetical protein FNN09_16060 [Carboxylicivirga sp. M1479]